MHNISYYSYIFLIVIKKRSLTCLRNTIKLDIHYMKYKNFKQLSLLTGLTVANRKNTNREELLLKAFVKYGKNKHFEDLCVY